MPPSARSGKQPHRDVVTALVRLVHAANRQHPGGERRIAGGLRLRPRLAKRAGRGCVPPGLHVDERQLPQDVGGKPLADGGPGGCERTVQYHGALAVEASHGVDEGGAQGRQHLRQHERIPGAFGLLGRAPQGLEASVS
jgi:hypothetical protein